MSAAAFTEDCCFNYQRDNCKGADCSCGCHVDIPPRPDCGHEAEIDRLNRLVDTLARVLAGSSPADRECIRSSVASGLGVMALVETIDKGGEIEIPSLGITLTKRDRRKGDDSEGD